MNKSIEPIILTVILVLLALVAGGLAYKFPSVADITTVTTMEPRGHAPAKLRLEEVQSSLAVWTAPALWVEPATRHRLFASDEYLFYPSAYPGGDYIKKIEPGKTVRSPSGIPLDWYEKYGLDFTDPNVDHEDPDGDGFSNIVEYRNEPVGQRYKAADCDPAKATNPHDAKSHPSYLARLRLQQYESRPFHIQFRGIEPMGGENEFQIFLQDVPSDKQPGFKKTGDPLGFEGWIVGPYVESIVNEMDPNTHLIRPVNKSTIELDKPEIGQKILVPYRQTVDSPESTADFVMLMPSERDKVIKISRGKVFSVPFIPETSFLVLDANDDGAKIRDTKTKQEYHILKLDTAEWDEVPASAQAAPPKSP